MAKIAAQMGESATSITPSNSSPVTLTANTPVNPTAGGYAIASYTEFAPSNASPTTLTNGSIYKIKTNGGKAVANITDVTPSSTPTSVSTNDVVKFGGNGIVVDSVPTPTSLTPSNTSPADIVSGGLYSATTGGKAVASITGLSPSLEPTQLSSGTIYQCGHSGYAVASLNTVTPSNSSPVTLTDRNSYIINHNGYAISSYTSVTPSSTQTAVSSGDIVKIGGSGVIVDSVPTPTSITPSNSSPVALTANTPVNPTASGYAISSYSSKTPSDTSPASVSSGAIIKASSSGYLVKNNPANLSSAPDKTYTNSNMANNATASITVTQKPRFIVLSLANRTNAMSYMVGIIDVTNSKAYRYGYWSSAFHNEDWSSGYTSYITSVSASSVGIKNVYGGAVVMAVGCYY